MDTLKAQILMQFLNDTSKFQYDLDECQEFLDKEDYIVCDDVEADELCSDLIKELLWAFNARFISSVTDLDASIFEAIQNNNKCESNNEPIRQLIDSTCGIEYFIEQAIMSDGRGHFISSYDGQENEVNFKNETYFIYRMN
jgi:hypothetical protein